MSGRVSKPELNGIVVSHVRSVTVSEIDQILALYPRTWSPKPSRISVLSAVQDYRNTVLVARRSENQEIVAMLTMIFYKRVTGLEYLVHDVIVAESMRHVGLGELIFEEAKRHLATLPFDSIMRLATTPDNPAAIGLYTKAGGERTERVQFKWYNK
jgi:ribosomal protein S18 acetylase RimI-like enzyme